MQQLLALVNGAYRGEGSRKGWTTEADLISGSLRVNEQAIKEMLTEPGAVIYTCNAGNELLGCVYLKEENKGLYLGMLSVSPDAQGLGIGKKLLKIADEHALEHHYPFISMTVIDVRHELIAWYERHGYINTNETKPFHTDEAFGTPVVPLRFTVLKKILK